MKITISMLLLVLSCLSLAVTPSNGQEKVFSHLIFQDTFDNNENVWSIDNTADITNGNLTAQVNVRANRGYTWITAPQASDTRFIEPEAEIHYITNYIGCTRFNDCNLAIQYYFNVKDIYTDFSMVEYNINGLYSVFNVVNGEWTELAIDVASVPLSLDLYGGDIRIQDSFRDTHRIRLEQDNLSIYINDRLIVSYAGEWSLDGTMGIGLYGLNSSNEDFTMSISMAEVAIYGVGEAVAEVITEPTTETITEPVAQPTTLEQTITGISATLLEAYQPYDADTLEAIRNDTDTLLFVDFENPPTWFRENPMWRIQDSRLVLNLSSRTERSLPFYQLLSSDMVSTGRPFEIELELSQIDFNPNFPFYITFAFNGQDIVYPTLIGTQEQYTAYNFVFTGGTRYELGLSGLLFPVDLPEPIEFDEDGVYRFRFVVNDGVAGKFMLTLYINDILIVETEIRGPSIINPPAEPVIKYIDGEISMFIGAYRGGRLSTQVDNLIIRNIEPDNYQPSNYVRSTEPVRGVLESLIVLAIEANQNSASNTVEFGNSYSEPNACAVYNEETSYISLQAGTNTVNGLGFVGVECNFSGRAGETIEIGCDRCDTLGVFDISGNMLLNGAGNVTLPSDGDYKLLVTANFGYNTYAQTSQQNMGTFCDTNGCADRYETVTTESSVPIFGTTSFNFVRR